MAKSSSYHLLRIFDITKHKLPAASPAVVVLKATVRFEVKVTISPFPSAASPGPIGIIVPNNPQPDPTFATISAFSRDFSTLNS